MPVRQMFLRTIYVFFFLFVLVVFADDLVEKPDSSSMAMSLIVFEYYEIIDSLGNDDGTIDPGESIALPVAVRNRGVDTAYSLTGTLRTTDPYVTITDSVEGFGDVPPDSVSRCLNAFDFDVAGDCPSIHAIDFELATIDADDQISTNNFSVFILGSDIFISVDTLDFESAFIGYYDTLEFQVSNIGEDILIVNDITSDNPDYSVDITSFSLLPGENQLVKVIFAPISEGLSDGSLTVQSDFSDTSIVFLQGEGLFPPDISVSPDSLDDSLFVDESSSDWLTLYNTGGSDLKFDIFIDVSIKEILGKSTNHLGSEKKSVPNKFGYMEFGKNEADPRVDDYVVLGSGGPDLFGYVWVDSDELVGCEFNWFDIRSTGKLVTGLDDDNYVGPYPMSFEFPFYDSVYTEFYICSNGYIGFGPTNNYSQYSNQPIPTNNAPNNIIAWCWDDLYPGVYEWGDVYYKDFGDRLIIQFVDFKEYGAGDGRINAEVIIYRSGKILIQYLNTYNNFDISGNTIGIENIEGSDGLQVAFNTDYIHDSLAVKFLNALGWIYLVNATSGSITPGDSFLLEVAFDATNFNGGDYYADIIINCNDPNESEIVIPTHLHVTGIPDIAVSEDSLNYGIVFTGYPFLDTLIVFNDGTDSLTVSNILSDNSDFTVDLTNFSLAPGYDQEVIVTFTPSATGAITGILTIVSNDPDESTLEVYLEGECLEPTDISISPDSLSDSLFSGEISFDTLTIYNTGLSNLSFDILVEEASVMAFRSFPENILIMEEAADTLYYDMALNNLGLSRTLVTYWGDLRSELNSGTDWDLVIVNSCGNDAPTSVLDLLDAYQSDGGLLIYSHWGVYRYPSHSLLTGLGISFVSDFTSPINFYAVDTEHALFTRPNAVSSFYWSDDPWNKDGQIVDTIGGATQMAYFEGYADKGAVVLNAEKNCIFNAFQTCNFNADDDSDGKVDIVELFENEIVFLLRPWLLAYPYTGTILPDSTIDIEVAFDATNLYGGNYQEDITIMSNDPDEPEVIIPVYLHVTGVPDITASEDSLNLGAFFVGLSVTDTLVVINEGTDSLFVSDISSDNSDYTIDTTNFVLLPEENQEIVIKFAPSVAGMRAGTLNIESNDPDNPVKEVFLQGEGLAAPVMTVGPDYISDTLTTGESANNILNIGNTGGNSLTFEIMDESLEGAGPLVALNKNQIMLGVKDKTESMNLLSKSRESQSDKKEFQSDRPEGSSPLAAGSSYTGDYLQFSISDYGEIIPFQYPIGTEHLRVGNYLSGYTVCCSDSIDKVEWAGYEVRSGIKTVSYTEIVNDVDSAVIDVITQTSGGELTITQQFKFDKHDQYVRTEINVENTSAALLNNVVFKKWVDWDMDGDYLDDNWDYDITHNMIYAWDQHYGAVAGKSPPDYRDIEGWDDYNRRITDEDYIDGPLENFDGLEILHYELGNLLAGEGKVLTFAYSAANNLLELKSAVERGIAGVERITVNPDTGTVLMSDSTKIEVTFNAASLYVGEYYSNLLISSNDPVASLDTVLCFLHVTGVPVISTSADTLEFSADSTDTLELRVLNDGTDNLQVTNISSDNSDYTVDISSFILLPDGNRIVKVIFTPTAVDPASGILTIQSNDPDKGTYTVALIGNAGSGIEENIPKVFSISANYPNPFCETTVIKYGCPERTKVSIQVFDIMGRLVNTLVDKEMDAGYYEVRWDGSTKSGRKVASAVYFCRMQAGDFKATKKMIFAK